MSIKPLNLNNDITYSDYLNGNEPLKDTMMIGLPCIIGHVFNNQSVRFKDGYHCIQCKREEANRKRYTENTRVHLATKARNTYEDHLDEVELNDALKEVWD